MTRPGPVLTREEQEIKAQFEQRQRDIELTQRIAEWFTGLMVIVFVVIFVTIVYVVIHFVIKFW